MSNMHLVKRQMEGLPLKGEITIKIEYQLCAKGSGRVVLAYDRYEEAAKQAKLRNPKLVRSTIYREEI